MEVLAKALEGHLDTLIFGNGDNCASSDFKNGVAVAASLAHAGLLMSLCELTHVEGTSGKTT